MYDGNGKELEPVPTPETKTPNLSSVYALSKYDQERLSLITGKAYNIPTTALRFFNVLWNPAGPFKSVYRCAGDFCLTPAE